MNMRMLRRHLPLIALAFNAFIENVFPTPPAELLLCAFVLREPERRRLLTAVCVAASVAGAVFGYVLGAVFYAWLRSHFESLAGFDPWIAQLRGYSPETAFFLALSSAVHLPPLKIACIGSGAAGVNFPMFVLIAAIVRGGKFVLLMHLTQRYGAEGLARIRRYKVPLVCGALGALAATLFFLLR